MTKIWIVLIWYSYKENSFKMIEVIFELIGSLFEQLKSWLWTMKMLYFYWLAITFINKVDKIFFEDAYLLLSSFEFL